MTLKQKLRSKKFMQLVADEITKGTGIANHFLDKDGYTLVYGFKMGNTYMTNDNGNGFYMAFVGDRGECNQILTCEDVNVFIKEAINIMNMWQESIIQ